MDAERRISDEVNTALVEAGLFRLLTPRRLGGYESGLRTAVEVTATLGAADGSTAWLVGIGTGAAWLLGMGSRKRRTPSSGPTRMPAWPAAPCLEWPGESRAACG